MARDDARRVVLGGMIAADGSLVLKIIRCAGNRSATRHRHAYPKPSFDRIGIKLDGYQGRLEFTEEHLHAEMRLPRPRLDA